MNGCLNCWIRWMWLGACDDDHHQRYHYGFASACLTTVLWPKDGDFYERFLAGIIALIRSSHARRRTSSSCLSWCGASSGRNVRTVVWMHGDLGADGLGVRSWSWVHDRLFPWDGQSSPSTHILLIALSFLCSSLPVVTTIIILRLWGGIMQLRRLPELRVCGRALLKRGK